MNTLTAETSCPFCKTDLKAGATVCPSCGARYGIKIDQTNIAPKEHVSLGTKRQIQFGAAGIAISVIAFLLALNSISGPYRSGATPLIVMGISFFGFLLSAIILLAGAIRSAQKNAWYR